MPGSSTPPRRIVIEDDEVIELDSDGIEVRSEDEEPTQSDLDFIASDDEVEAELLITQTMGQELDDAIDNLETAPQSVGLQRQASIAARGLMRISAGDIEKEDDEDDEDYIPPPSDEDASDDEFEDYDADEDV